MAEDSIRIIKAMILLMKYFPAIGPAKSQGQPCGELTARVYGFGHFPIEDRRSVKR